MNSYFFIWSESNVAHNQIEIFLTVLSPVFAVSLEPIVHVELYLYSSNLIVDVCFKQRKRHELALKKRRAIKRKEQQAEYAKLLAVRQKEKTQKKKADKKKRLSSSSSVSRTTSRSSYKWSGIWWK